jgi:hypothetical protein
MGKRNRSEELLAKIKRVGGGAARVERGDEGARAISAEGVLVEAGSQFHGSHLHPLARQGGVVADGRLRALGAP